MAMSSPARRFESAMTPRSSAARSAAGGRAPAGAPTAAVGVPAFMRPAAARRAPVSQLEAAAERMAERVVPPPEGAREQAVAAPGLPATATLAAHAALARLGAGEALPASSRAHLESRMGHDLSDVRVHTGADAARSARALGARAFTAGRDIVFGGGEFAPATRGGLHLLAHEAAHVVQQRERAADSAPAVLRFASREHEELGNVTAVMQIDLGNGVLLSWGQIVALAGDYYGTEDDLLADTRTPDGRQRIRAALEQYGSPGVAVTTLPAPTPDARSQTMMRYARLALENTPHFLEGGTSHETWLSYHVQAIETALRGGLAADAPAMMTAYATEAFGDHFLTDSFSGGHIRTPRQEIIEWYTTVWAPGVADRFVDTLVERVIRELTAQASAQLPGYVPDSVIEGKVRDRVAPMVAAAIASIGGRGELARWFGLLVGGAVAGAIHDMEGRRGVVVWSLDHPVPWTSVGDSRLGEGSADAAETRHEAEEAVLLAQQDVDRSYMIGLAEGRRRDTVPAPSRLPSRVHFGFDRDAVPAAAEGELEQAGTYLVYHPEARVHLTGHADERGSDAYNMDLGQRRADHVAAVLEREGADAAHVTADSLGESTPVGGRVRPYWRNRRVELVWSEDPSAPPVCRDIAYERASAQVRAAVGPPYDAERRLPMPLENANPLLPDWHWGSLEPGFQAEVSRYVVGQVRPLVGSVTSARQLDPVTVSDSYPVVGTLTATVEPRRVVQRIIDDLLADPIVFLEGATGGMAQRPPITDAGVPAAGVPSTDIDAGVPAGTQ